MSYLHKTKYEFEISAALYFRIFGFHKHGLIKRCSSFERQAAYKILRSPSAVFASTSEVRTSAV